VTAGTETEAEAYLKSSAIRLARLCRKSFGITGKPDELRVEGERRVRDVIAFMTEYAAAIRPQGLSPEKTLPTPSPGHLRSFLWTSPVADAVLNDVVRLSLYSDQIIITDPFSTFFSSATYQPGPAGPQSQPEKWIEQFVNWALLICALEPWFTHDLAILIPDPDGFVPDLPPFEAAARDAMQRGLLPRMSLAEVEQDALEKLALTTQGDDDLDAMLQITIADWPPDRVAAMREALVAYRAAHPTRYVHRVANSASVFSGGSGHNLFKAAWLADHVGGFLVPRGPQERLVFQRFTRGEATKDNEDALATAFAAADLPMLNNVSLATALDLRESGRLGAFRSFLHDVWSATSDPGEDIKSSERERRLVNRMKDAHATATDEWHDIYKDLGVKGAYALFAVPLAQVIAGGLIPASAGALTWIYKNWSGSARGFRRKSEALLVQLEHQSSPNPIHRVLNAVERKI
jgi:hypothetical protein